MTSSGAELYFVFLFYLLVPSASCLFAWGDFVGGGGDEPGSWFTTGNALHAYNGVRSKAHAIRRFRLPERPIPFSHNVARGFNGPFVYLLRAKRDQKNRSRYE